MVYLGIMKEFTSQIFPEGKMYVAYAPELGVSSCATTKSKAKKNLLEAVRLFLEEAGEILIVLKTRITVAL